MLVAILIHVVIFLYSYDFLLCPGHLYLAGSTPVEMQHEGQVGM